MYERLKRRRRGLSNFLYTRYADDWVVLCNGTREQAESMKQELQTVLETMGLKLSMDKTKLTHITEGFTFLGYRIIREMGTSKMVVKVEIPEDAIKKFRYRLAKHSPPTPITNR
jgi:RNA-directed DNA polymerase